MSIPGMFLTKVLLIGIVLSTAAACGDDGPTEPAGGSGGPLGPVGSLEVTTVTTGAAIDSDGYVVSVEGRPEQSVDVNATSVFFDLTTGDYEVTLTGVAFNCAVTGANRRTLAVEADETSSITFLISCTGGSIRVTAFTTGSSLDPDGYGISLDGGPSQQIGIDASSVVSDLDEGDHEVALTGLAPNCTVAGANPRTVAVVAGAEASESFAVACAFLSIDIAFSTRRDGQLEIYGMKADGSSVVRLTNHAADDNYPAWSPDGSMIAFSRDDGVFVTQVGGSSPVQLTNGVWDFEPAWSPGGSKIAFTRDENGWYDLEIYVMDADGSNLVGLTDDTGGMGAAWSPDGSKIAFGYDEILMMNADGSNLVNVTNHPGYDFSPAWSPDGSRIAFVSSRDGNQEVYVMDADGSGQVNLTNNPGFDSHPTWSRDGTKIAFTTNRDGNTEIYVMGADGSGLVNLTNHPAPDGEPAWSR